MKKLIYSYIRTPKHILKYIKNYRFIKNRLGKCNQCGKCCVGCPYYKNDRCVVYKIRPLKCRIDPINANKRKINCGYYWDYRK
jgi:hypothetical protein